MLRIAPWAVLSLCLFSVSAAAANLATVLTGPQRSADYAQRDAARKPLQTLQYFGLEPDMTVVEIWPGGGWYTEILAPYLREQGTFYAAHFNPEAEREYFRKSLAKYQDKLAANPAAYDKVRLTAFEPPQLLDIAPPGSADLVLTFRNVHNWYMRGGGEEKLLAAFEAMHRALKRGGVLGVVEHALPADAPLSMQERSGYMREDYVVNIAEKVGFVLVDSSNLHHNPLDDADHPRGVWTLPPRLALGEENIETYLTIGESNRMTLKFMKP